MTLVADVDGMPVAYRSAGTGDPIVLLHGFLCDSRCWRTQLDGLSEGFRVVAWDAPGAGGSPDPPEGYAITDWARCLAAFLDAVGIERAHFLGLSWGGLLAQELYRMHAERVRALILCDTYAGWRGSLGVEAAAKRLERCVVDSQLPGDELAARWAPEMFTETAPPNLVDEMSMVMRDFHPHGFRSMARTLAESDTTELLPEIDVPTLLLWGEADRRSPVTVAEGFLREMPNAELAVLAGAGHLSNMEQPAAFDARVRDFCSRA